MAKLSGPGRIGSISKLEKSLKGKGNRNIRQIPSEGSLTVRLLDEPEDFYGYYQHWMQDGPIPCTDDDCAGCSSDDEEERRKTFRYLANAYSVDDSKVVAVELPKTAVEQLAVFYKKYHTLLDRDYDLTKTGSGKNGTRYFASPDAPSKMKLSRFEKLDLEDELMRLVDDDNDDDDAPKKSKSKSKKSSAQDESPWESDRPKKKKSKNTVVKKSATVKKSTKSAPARRVVKKTK